MRRRQPADGELAVAWTNAPAIPDDVDNIYGRRFQPPNDASSVEEMINTVTVEKQADARVVIGESAEWLVVWQNEEVSPFDQTVRMQVLDAAGKVGGEVIAAWPEMLRTHSGVASRAVDGGYFVAWIAPTSGGGGDLYGALLSGGKLSAPKPISTGTATPALPAIETRHDGSVVIVR